MKPVLAVIVAALVAVGPVAAPVAAFPAEGAVTSLSVVPASGRAELVIGVDGGVDVNDFTLRSPDRIVLDVSAASLAVGARRYDHVARGGITDVRFSQYRKGTVRVVIYLDSQRGYDVSREDGQVRVSVATDPNATFAGWQIGQPPRVASTASRAERRAEPRRETRAAPRDDAGTEAAAPAAAGEPGDADRADADSDADRIAERPVARTASRRAAADRPMRIVQQAQQRSQQPRITVTYQQADIRDVLAAFAAFSGRTIIPSSSIPAIRVDAEIKDQPWDVALQAILASQGLAATEDQNGILIVDTQDRIAARAQTEPLQTRVLRLNYQRATPVAEQLRTRLLQCIPAERSGNAGGAPAGQPPVAGAPPAQPTLAGGVNPGPSAPAPGMEFGACRGRGSITADEVTNAVSITAPVSMLDDLVSFAESLDLRQPQVNIKAKIVLVNRTDLDALGIKYDLGSRNQFFSQVIQRVDSAGNLGTPADPPRVVLGGNTVSAIANASGTVNGAALRLIYSTALGGFDFSTFLDALQEVSLLDIQAEPSVTTLNNKTAELVSGVQVPFVPLISSGGSATQLNAPITVERIQTGVTLRVTPSVTNNGQIMMRVETVNSDVNFTNNGTLIDNNSNKTELLVGDGETVVIAGLTQTSVRVSKSGIPLLVDLPLIGRLFGYTTKQEQRRDLLILLTPHVIDEGESPADGAQR